jgi:23S rRNA (adenine2503-C2)-methyltransferase
MQGIQLVQYDLDGPCCKLRFRLEDELQIETVFHYPDWVCVSTQAGCPAACVFCEAGGKNFKRNLSRSEIIAQVIVSDQLGPLFFATNSEHSATPDLSKNRFQTISFSGMGEPLLNLVEGIKTVCQKCSYAY